MKKLTIVLLLCCCGALLIAQKTNYKFGNPEKKAVMMEHHPGDSSVTAAILYDHGEFFPNQFLFRWRRRFKVYTREGLDYFIMTSPSRYKGDVRGYVFNMEDGKVKKEKIKKEHIYIEEYVKGRNRVRIAPPNLKAGSVIDLEFSFNGFPSNWYFQYAIPVLHSELILPDNSNILFRTHQTGYESVKREGPRYVAKNLPPFKSEPYMNSRDNYVTKLIIDIKEIQTSWMYREEYANRWSQICQNLWQHNNFGELVDNQNLFLNDIAKDLRSKTSDRDQLISLALDTVHHLIEWNEESLLFPVSDFRELLRDGTGSSADMNFLFILLLNKLDIESYPLAMSRRSEGLINPMFPSMEAMNYVISYIPGEEGYLLVDASDKFIPIGLLPDRALNNLALLINGKGVNWIDILPGSYDSKMISCNLGIDDQLLTTGKIMRRYEDYAACDYVRKWNTYANEDEYIESVETANGCYVNSFSSSAGNGKSTTVQEELSVEMDALVKEVGSMLSFCPVIMDKWKVNPFKLEDRQYPVDFSTPRKRMYILNMQIPEGYSVEQLPEPVSISNESKSIQYLYNIHQNGNILQVVIQMSIKKPVFYQDEYNELKSIFNLIVTKENEQVILKKT